MAEEIKNGKAVKQQPEKKEKVGIGARVKTFFTDYKSELKRVVWPTRDQVVRNTGVVLVAIIFMAVIIGVLDLIFGTGTRLLPEIRNLF